MTLVETPVGPGDRVVAARDIDTTQRLHIAGGTGGVVAEDRVSTLVVFFDDESRPANVKDGDVRKVPEQRSRRGQPRSAEGRSG